MNKLTLKLNEYDVKSEILVILGSGLDEYTKNLEVIDSFSLSQVYNIKTDESIGHKGLIYLAKLNNRYFFVMSGRLHYYENTSDEMMREIIQSFAYYGVKTLIVTNACGGMNEEFKPGDIMIINDHINMSGRNPLVGKNNSDLGPRFVDMSVAYDLDYRNLVKEIARKNKIAVKEGIYVSYLGPSYETPAEIRAYRLLGGDVVGMSTVPEVIVARHAGLRVLGLSVITNLASGLSKTKLNHQEVLINSQKAVANVRILLNDFIENMDNK